MRSKQLFGEIPSHIFYQLKDIFQILETLGSARIEGNNTTLVEYIDNIIEKRNNKDEKHREIVNLEKAIQFIEDHVDSTTAINSAFVFELHKIITKNLSAPPYGEGSRFPGMLRKNNVSIKNSTHTPPNYMLLQDYFEAFLDFINADYKEQYQLLMVAIAHHRFSYIHPFDNGNGRMGRLLNYALLIKLGFQVKKGRIINPSSVFYADRKKYYDMLAKADSLKDKDVLAWAEYFLLGLKNELEKIDSLLNRRYVQEKILLPALKSSLDRKYITEREYKILKYSIFKDGMTIKAAELDALGIKSSVNKSRAIAALRKKGILKSVTEGGRIYTIDFANNYLLRGVIESLNKEEFVSDFLNRQT